MTDETRPANPPFIPASTPLPDARQPVDTATDFTVSPTRAVDDLYDDTVVPEKAATTRVSADAVQGRAGRDILPVEDTTNGRQTDLPDSEHSLPLEEHDPCSDRPAVHPVGTGVGAAAAAAAGAATGAAIGALAGPVGAAVGVVVGGAIGGFAGGYAGRNIAEAFSPSCEEQYWRKAYRARPYVARGACYDEYKSAYTFGIEARQEFHDKNWSDVESILQSRWEASPCAEKMPWPRAQHAICDAWDRLTPRERDM